MCLFSQSWAQLVWETTTGPFSGYIRDILGARNGAIFVAAGIDGLYRSSDNGATWQLLNHGLAGERAYRIVSTFSGVLFLDTGGKVYRSLDYGQTWVHVLSGAGYARDFWSFSRDSVETVYLFAEFGFLHSSNLGQTWSAVDGLANAGRVFSMLQTSEGSLWTGTQQGLFRQRSDDTSWVESAQGLPEVGVTALLELPNHSLLAGTYGEGVYVLADGDMVWQPADLRKTWVDALARDGNGRIIAVQYGLSKFYSSEDGGMHWRMLDSLAVEMQSFYLSGSGERYAGAFTGNILYSTEAGKWKQIGPPIMRGIDVLDVNVTGTMMAGSTGVLFRASKHEEGWLPRAWLTNHLWDVVHTSRGTLLALVLTGSVLRSEDDGQSWQYVSRLNADLRTFAIDSREVLFIGSGSGVFWSEDEGGTWHQVLPDILRYEGIVKLVVNKQDHLFAVTADGKIFRSTTRGLRWEYVSTVPAYGASSLGVDSEDRLFVGFRPHGVFRSDQNGAGWQQINNGLDSIDVNDVAVNSNDDLFVATATGAYASTDHGDNWHRLGDGIPVDGVYRLALDSDERLYAGTYESGVFRTANSTLTAVGQLDKVPAKFDLAQNYPNPFNPETSIRFTLAQPGRVELDVYDLLGEKISRLLDQRMDAGVHEVKWIARNDAGMELASGVYLYRLKTDHEMLIKKMLLLR
ncbi:MAG: T9SS type A sorting domain-containing protein [bacterium]